MLGFRYSCSQNLFFSLALALSSSGSALETLLEYLLLSALVRGIEPSQPISRVPSLPSCRRLLPPRLAPAARLPHLRPRTPAALPDVGPRLCATDVPALAAHARTPADLPSQPGQPHGPRLRSAYQPQQQPPAHGPRGLLLCLPGGGLIGDKAPRLRASRLWTVRPATARSRG